MPKSRIKVEVSCFQLTFSRMILIYFLAFPKTGLVKPTFYASEETFVAFLECSLFYFTFFNLERKILAGLS